MISKIKQKNKIFSEIIETEIVENALEGITKRQRPNYEKKLRTEVLVYQGVGILDKMNRGSGENRFFRGMRNFTRAVGCESPKDSLRIKHNKW